MRHLVTFILVMLVLGVMVPGCGGAHRYDGRLTAADSLLRSEPDSALAMIEAMSRDSLPDEGDRAYRDLLLTQARYRCYVTATSDSDINSAVAWFSAHPSDREKLTRAYIYKGAVMEELGHPDSAMLYYKTAEATAAPDDYFNLGYSNLRIGILYQSWYYNDSAVVSRMQNATNYFITAGDSSYLASTIGTQGLFKNVVGKDSAIHYLEKAIKLGKDANSSQQYYFQSKLAGIYFYNKDYQRSKDLSLDIIANGREDCEENKFYYYAARSYIKLNHIDSALWVKSLIPDPLDAVDSMNYLLLLSELAQAKGDYQGYAHHSHEAHMIDERITESSLESTLPVTELHFDVLQRENKLIKDHEFNAILLIGGFLTLVVILIVCGVIVIRRLNLRYEKQLQEAQQELEKLINDTEHKENAQLSERIQHQRIVDEKERQLAEFQKRYQELEKEHKNVSSHVSNIFLARQAALNELYQNLRIKKEDENNKRHQYLTLASGIKLFFTNGVSLRTPLKESFWDNLTIFVNGEYRGIATFVKQKYPDLTEKEMHLFLLICAGFPNPIIKLCMGYASDVTVSKNKKRLMKERFRLDMVIEEFIQLFLQGKLG